MIARRTFLRGASALPLGGLSVAAIPAPVSASERRLAEMLGRLGALEAHAERHAVGARLAHDDPYTVAVADIDGVAAEMAALPADMMVGVLLKLRALEVPIAGEDEDSPLSLSVCRGLQRLRAAEGIGHG